MQKLLRTAKEQWDRLITYSLFAVFGFVSIVRPYGSFKQTPDIFRILLNFEFAIAGVILLTTIFYPNMALRRAGYAAYFFGAVTVAGLIMFNSGSTFSILCLAFGFQGVLSVRYIGREKRASSELAEVARQMQERENDA